MLRMPALLSDVMHFWVQSHAYLRMWQAPFVQPSKCLAALFFLMSGGLGLGNWFGAWSYQFILIDYNIFYRMWGQFGPSFY